MSDFEVTEYDHAKCSLYFEIMDKMIEKWAKRIVNPSSNLVDKVEQKIYNSIFNQKGI